MSHGIFLKYLFTLIYMCFDEHINKIQSNTTFTNPLSSSYNFLPNNKVLDWSKLKAFADNKVNSTEKLKFVFGSVENVVGKGENASFQHFLLFPQCFQKASFLWLLTVRIVR